MSNQPNLFPESPLQQPFDLFKQVMAMMNGDVAGWLHFVDLVKEMIKAHGQERHGVPHSKQKALIAESAVQNIIREIAEYQSTPSVLSLLAEGGDA
ncbi:hypothetical protein [Limnoglobus roseus]|uniref:Uncharacterized protein n=1 Tax=Limnoglobus roseus TaxID=2598579 RepID=A0A5C1AKG3_9BACT|nr:hypothetical protein [Limnoglobus roseus]QEL18506.1 hypothetical protein PX52LOC_05532 [Limnoglobus roseus]